MLFEAVSESEIQDSDFPTTSVYLYIRKYQLGVRYDIILGEMKARPALSRRASQCPDALY
jgi:hypothetical protein